jgi:hypothetical protein
VTSERVTATTTSERVTATTTSERVTATTTRQRVVTLTMGAAGAIVAFAFARGDHRVYAYLAVAALLLASGALVDRRVQFEPAVLGLLGASLVLHLCGGLLPGLDQKILYDQWILTGVLKVDQLVHFVSSAALTIACWSIIRRWLRADLAPAGPAFVAALMACGFGAINELFEFLASLLLHDLDVGGQDNTGWDLAFNLAGAIAVATWLSLRAQVHDVTNRDRASLAVGHLDHEVAALVDVQRGAGQVASGQQDANPPTQRR